MHVSRNFLRTKLFVALLLAFALNIPLRAISEEVSIQGENPASIATTTVETATSTGTTTLPTLPTIIPEASPQEPALDQPGETILQEASQQPEPPAEAPVLPEQDLELRPVFTTRHYTKDIVLDPHALHSCEATTFRVDISSKHSAKTGIVVSRSADIPYVLEIGSLPDGIDIRFEETDRYEHRPSASEQSVMLAIAANPNAQKGDFMVPIFFTGKKGVDSSVVCQINLVNLE